MDSLNRWQDRAEIVVGIWLCLSPWILNLPQAAAWSAMIVGVYVILLAMEDMVLPSQIEDWGDAVLGIGLIISPWAWGYADDMTATLNAFICGLLVSGFAFWTLGRIFVKHEEQIPKEKHS